MRKNDITIGEDYGYKPYGQDDTPRRVKVLELGVTRKVYDGTWSRYAKTVNDGVLVQRYDWNNEELRVKDVTTKETVEVSPEVVVEEFGYTIPARYETRETVTTVPDTEITTTRKLTQAWDLEVKAAAVKVKREADSQAAKNRNAEDTKTAAKRVASLLGKDASGIRETGAYTSDRRFYIVGVVIPLDELKALIALADEAVSNRNAEEAKAI